MTTTQHRKNDYLVRTNRVIDFVLQNLDQPLRLEQLAEVACFSPCHFHRVFKALTGETLAEFVKRSRLQRALSSMHRNPERSLTDIALECGFSSSSEFSRSFKRSHGVAPRDFDLEQLKRAQRDTLVHTLDGTEAAPKLDRLAPGRNPDGFAVELIELPERTVAYARVFDPYRPRVVEDAARDMIDWARERALDDGQWLGYMWDDPDVVPLPDCRYDVGLVVPPTTAPDEQIGMLQFPPMRVAQLELDGDIELEQRALDWLFGTWLPNSRFLPTDQPCFEAWRGRPFEHGVERFTLAIQLPVADNPSA